MCLRDTALCPIRASNYACSEVRFDRCVRRGYRHGRPYMEPIPAWSALREGRSQPLARDARS